MELNVRKIVSGLLFFGVLQAHAEKYNIDSAHTAVNFKVKHLVIATVNGRFDKFEGTVEFDEKIKKLSAAEVKVDVDSVDTNEADRDKHLRGADFFGTRKEDGSIVEEKRWMIFKMKKVNEKGGKPATVEGDLTLNGFTKPFTLNVDYKGATSDPWGNEKIIFTATGKIARKDFGITWNKKLDKGGVTIGEDVDVIIEGEANKEKKDKK
jgi:polyisoprenoid-binding protein YceI